MHVTSRASLSLYVICIFHANCCLTVSSGSWQQNVKIFDIIKGQRTVLLFRYYCYLLDLLLDLLIHSETALAGMYGTTEIGVTGLEA